MNPEDLKYFIEQYPELDREDIIDILEAMIDDEPATPFTDYLKKDEDEPIGIEAAYERIRQANQQS